MSFPVDSSQIKTADAQKSEKSSQSFPRVELADGQKSEKSFQVVFTERTCTDNGKDEARAGIGVLEQ